MSSLDDELRQLTPLPLDLQLAVNEILNTFAGMLIRIDPISLVIVSNLKEKGEDMAKLFRLYAEIIEKWGDNFFTVDITPNKDSV